jgi:hypothetical protein
VARSGRRGGVPVEGSSDVVAAASGAVRRLEVEVRGSCRRCIGARRKARHEGRRGHNGGGQGKSGDTWRGTRRGALAPTGGARLAAGGRGGERRGAHVGRPGKEMEWAEPGENTKWAGPDEQ